MAGKDLDKLRKKAARLSRPTPVELPSGKWRCQIMVNGERVSVVDDDPATAHAKALALKAGFLEKEKPASSLTVGEAIDKYIESKDAVLSPSTIRGYKQIRRDTLQDLMGVLLRDLSQEKVQKAINKMAKTCAPKYVRNAHGLLSAALSVYLPDFTLHTTLPQRRKKDIYIPSTEEINILANAAKGSDFELPFLLAAWMGLRTSEIRGLTWGAVSGNTLYIKQALVDGPEGAKLKGTKTYSGTRKLKMPAYISELFSAMERKGNDDFVFDLHRTQLYKRLDALCKSCKLPHFRFHDLRHYQASVMLALGVPDKYAMERMGHASTHMLKTVYQHTMKEKEKEIDEAMNLFFEENLHTKLHTKK